MAEGFPKAMMHPAYQPGVVGAEVTDRFGFKSYNGGRPARWPPVTVNDHDTQLYYESKGYVPQGRANPVAFAQAKHAAATNTALPQPRYPRWAGGVIVNNEEEEEKALEARREQLGIKPEVQVVEAPTPVYRDAEIEALKTMVESLKDELQSFRDPPAPVVSAAEFKEMKEANERLAAMLEIMTIRRQGPSRGSAHGDKVREGHRRRRERLALEKAMEVAETAGGEETPEAPLTEAHDEAA